MGKPSSGWYYCQIYSISESEVKNWPAEAGAFAVDKPKRFQLSSIIIIRMPVKKSKCVMEERKQVA